MISTTKTKFAAAACALLLVNGCTSIAHNPEGEVSAVVVPDCRIEADGMLNLAEMPVEPGIVATYVRNAPDAPLPTPEGLLGQGPWDFSEGPDQTGARLTIEDLVAAGLADEFPGAGWAVPLSPDLPNLLGLSRVVEHGDGTDTIELMGMATRPEDDPARHWRLHYDEPLPVLPMPLAEGDSWDARATFRDARLGGLPTAGVEDWSFEVEAVGTALLEGGVEVEQVLRIRSSVERTLAVSQGPHTETRYQLLWLAPCFGELARLEGTDEELVEVVEYRRLRL